MNPYLKVACRLRDEAEQAWNERVTSAGELRVRDDCDRWLLLGWVVGFRRFRSIVREAEDPFPSAESMMVLNRSLVSLAHRTLYLVQSDDPRERHERLLRWMLVSYLQQRKFIQALLNSGDERFRPMLDPIERAVDALTTELNTAGVTWTDERQIFPTDERIAQLLKLTPHYEDVYRDGSGDMHYTVFSALSGYAVLEGPTPPVSLYGDDDPRGEVSHATGRAVIVYGDFVSKADKVVELGMKQKVTELIPLMEHAVKEANAET
jgi:hypothetical protein